LKPFFSFKNPSTGHLSKQPEDIVIDPPESTSKKVGSKQVGN
jgi:hypothetical protein